MRYALGIEYDGSGFLGWQSQKQGPTVQDSLEAALGRVADHDVSVVCAGRTDTGVHARGQVVHFDSEADRDPRSWLLGANSNLPDAVSALWIRPVSEDFHARFSAFERSYRYEICNRWIRPALGRDQVTWVRKPLDAGRMHRAVQALLGEHDFSAFRSAGCKARHAVREIRMAEVSRSHDRVYFDIAANGFLYHMVRNIIGSLLDVGAGERDETWMGELLAGGDRTRAGVTAPASGLCFMSVRYPDHFGLPSRCDAFPNGEAP
jgi:tRNA pseudouridine38-40 synthase